MNDLENDLRQVFERRAGDMGTSPEAPKQVLRRGRRRQVATTLGGAVAAIGAIALVVGVGAALLRNPTNQVPAFPVGTAPYGERTASIQGLSVTAPEGWTLIDDWPLSTVIPSGSQTCSFSATGVPVNPSGDETVASAVEPTSSCTGTVESLPAGVPVLQLANFEIPLSQTVCGLEGHPPATVPSGGVAVYVAQTTSGDGSDLSLSDVGANCPEASMVVGVGSSGPWPAIAVLVAGPDASPADLAVAHTFIDQLGSATVSMSPPVTLAPGYVVAAGNDAGTPWRIEASVVFSGRSSAGTIEAIAIDQDASGHDHAYDVPAPVDSQLVAASGRSIGDGSTLTWGTADAEVSTLEVVADTGSWTATLVPWPTGLADPVGGTAPSGSIWWVINPPVKGAIRVTLTDGTTRLLSGNDTAPTAAAELPPAEFPGDLLSFGQDDGIGYVFGETNGGQPGLLIGIGPAERSNPMTFGRGGPAAWPTNRPLTFVSSNTDGGAVLGTVPQGVAEVKVTTGDGQVRTVKTFQDLRPEFGGVVGWFVVVPEPAAGAGHLEAAVQYFDGNGNEAYPADHLP